MITDPPERRLHLAVLNVVLSPSVYIPIPSMSQFTLPYAVPAQQTTVRYEWQVLHRHNSLIGA